MRVAIALLVVFLFASICPANPSPAWPALFIDFDEDGLPDGDPVDDYVQPPAYTNISAYVGLSCNGSSPSESFSAVSFRLSNPLTSYPGVVATATFTNLIPGDLSIGDVFMGGVTLVPTECVTTPCVFLGRVDMFYLGGSCCVEILDHADYPRWVVDCQEPAQIHYYCVGSHGNIGGATCLPAEYCGFFPCDNPSPVENVTWGAIKALYR